MDELKTERKTGHMQQLWRFGLPAIISMAICIGSAIGTAVVLTYRLEERVSGLQGDFVKHDQDRHAEIVRVIDKLDNHEQRITRIEVQTNAFQDKLNEIGSDVKILLRGGMQ